MTAVGCRQAPGWSLGALLALCVSQPCWGISFLSFDARAISMGGSGVVTARSHNASLFNPALLIDHDPSKHTRLHGHFYVGARLIDRDNFLETADHFRTRYEGVDLASLLDGTIDLAPSRYSTGESLRDATAIIREVQDDINQLSNKPLRASGSYGFAFGYPLGRWAWGGYHRQFVVLGSVVRVADVDNAAIDRVTGTIDRFADLLDEVANTSGMIDHPEGLMLADVVDAADRLSARVMALNTYINFDRLRTDVEQNLFAGRNVHDYLREPIPDSFFSTIESRGAEVTEQALSGARSFAGGTLLPRDLHLGITLKQVDFITVSFEQLVNEFSLSAYRSAENRRHYRRVNVDLGLVYDLSEYWQVGAVVRNIIPYDFVTVAGDGVPMRPVARLGFGYRQGPVRVSLDMDVTRNEPLGFDPDKQFVSLGLEWFVWRNTALRAGLRTNRVDGETLPSLGVGFGGRRGHLDVALARSLNGDEWGLGLQAGLAF